MKIYVFTDLDDTLFNSLRKVECTESNLEQEHFIPMAVSKEGKALSYSSPKQQSLLALFEHAHIVPVTARNLDAFSRVSLPPWHSFHGAILNYGATILREDKTEDIVWKKSMEEKLLPFQASMENILQRILEFAALQHLEIRPRLITQDGLHFYVVIKNMDPENDHLPIIVESSGTFLDAPKDWFVHHNDNNVAFIPCCLNKAYALRYYIDTYINPLGEKYMTLGFGDSLIDLDFMALCDYALVPQNSQIKKIKFS